jgi:hypothetical protein
MRAATTTIAAALATCFIAGAAFAQTNQKGIPSELTAYIESKSEIESESALIRTKADLQFWINVKGKSNPLNLLSADAKTRLVENAMYNDKGLITSGYIGDIRRELTPTQAYKVLSLFGAQSIAAKANNGKARTDLDRLIINTKATATPEAVVAGYCNGGYCTANPDMSCNTSTCKPPGTGGPFDPFKPPR